MSRRPAAQSRVQNSTSETNRSAPNCITKLRALAPWMISAPTPLPQNTNTIQAAGTQTAQDPNRPAPFPELHEKQKCEILRSPQTNDRSTVISEGETSPQVICPL